MEVSATGCAAAVVFVADEEASRTVSVEKRSGDPCSARYRDGIESTSPAEQSTLQARLAAWIVGIVGVVSDMDADHYKTVSENGFVSPGHCHGAVGLSVGLIADTSIPFG